MSDDSLLLVPVIKVGGQELPAIHYLLSLTVDLQLGLVGRATLRFHDTGPDFPSTAAFGLEAEVEISGPPGSGIGLIFAGTVVGAALEWSETQPTLVVTVDDAAHKLAHGTTTKTYLNGTMSDAVQTLASARGLQVQSASAESAAHPYLLQSGTDLDFLNEICARTGRVWWIDGKSTLRFEKAGFSEGGGTTVTYGENVIAFSVKATSLRPDKVQVVGWDPAQQAAIVANSASPAHTPDADLVSPFLADLGDGAKTLVVRDAAPLDAEEATAMASAILATAASDGVVARGTVDFNPAIALSTTVEVAQAGPSSGKYLVTGVEHDFRDGMSQTTFVAGPHRPRHLVDVLNTASALTGFSLPGVVTGVVTNADDPDNAGRVKVKYANQGTAVESPWARVVTLGAGKGRGLEFQPEVNDEVLITFEQGDTRRPLVLGGLFSTKNTLPASPTAGNVEKGAVTFRRITSRLGHVIELADGDQDPNKHVLVKLAGGEGHLRIGADKTELSVDNKELTITNGAAKIVLTDTGDIKIKGKSISFEVDTDITMKAQSKISAEGQVTVELKAATVKLDSKAQTTVQSAGITAVKGNAVMIN